MKERTTAAIITGVLAVFGIATIYFSLYYSDFNFYKSEIVINGNYVRETLNFKPDKPYHTLYRDFESSISYKNLTQSEIKVFNIVCSEGKPYVNSYSRECFNLIDSDYPDSNCLPYTEKNELGCTFGNVYGFEKNKNYKVSSDYYLTPYSVVKIENKYYIKFVAYAKDRHKLLILNRNFFVGGEVVIPKRIYLPQDAVVIYIPVKKAENWQDVVYENSFYKGTGGLMFLLILFALLPSAVFFSVWYFLGREKTFADLPESLSVIPSERKGWEIATYFHPPFGVIDNQFFASLILDLRRRKIIELKTKDKETWIKLPKDISKGTDEVEKQMLSILEDFYSELDEKHKDAEGFAKLNKLVGKAASFGSRIEILEFQKEIKKHAKEYLDMKGQIIFFLAIFPIIVAINLIQEPIFFVFYILFYIFVSYLARTTALLTSYKKDFHIEYQKWRAFRKYLKEFPSMRDAPHEAIVMWEKYLVYATALGVSKQVLKKLKEWKIIDNNQFVMFSGIHSSSNSFASSAGTSGGGVGGAGGGGVGGGGGGGR